MSSTVDSKITLVSYDHEVFEVDRTVVEEWQTIKDLLADIYDGGKVPLPNVSSKILAKVIEYSKKHVEYKAKTDESRAKAQTAADAVATAHHTVRAAAAATAGAVSAASAAAADTSRAAAAAADALRAAAAWRTATAAADNLQAAATAAAEAAAAAADAARAVAEFVKVNQATLFDLILAANYLNIRGLLDLTCQTVADMIKEKTPEEIRKIYKIKNDRSPEEEEEVRRENQWAFE